MPMGIDTSKLGPVILIFILVIVGLALTPTVSDYANTITEGANSSEILVVIAQCVDVIWFVGVLGLAGMIGYVAYVKK